MTKEKLPSSTLYNVYRNNTYDIYSIHNAR